MLESAEMLSNARALLLLPPFRLPTQLGSASKGTALVTCISRPGALSSAAPAQQHRRDSMGWGRAHIDRAGAVFEFPRKSVVQALKESVGFCLAQVQIRERDTGDAAPAYPGRSIRAPPTH